MRAAFVLVFAFGTTACVNSALYYPGPNTFVAIDRPGDGYVATSQGTATNGLAGEAAESQDLEGAYALGPVVLLARRSETRTSQGAPIPPDINWVRHSQVEFGVGRLARNWEGARIQDVFVVARNWSDAATSSNADDDPPFRVDGRYWRAYLQRSAVVRKKYLDAGTSLRLSVVHADRYQKWARSGFIRDYTVAEPDTGSLTGYFLEPGFMFRVGYKAVKIGPVISAPLALNKTAYDVQPLSLTISLSVSYTPLR